MHLKLLITSILLTLLTSAQQEGDNNGSSADIDQQWKDFKVKFGKSYESSSEEMFRKKIFVDNLNEIEAHNELFSEGLTSYTTGINQFHDMEEQEFTEKMSCLDVNDIVANSSSSSTVDPITKNLPAEIDWRTKGYVTPVKDQLTCGSCWAFAATGALESLMARTTGTPVSLSEQNLVDCSFANNGCSGGTPGKAFAYVLNNDGINTEASYPYEGNISTCRYQPNDVGSTCDYFFAIFGESNIQAVVSTAGPVAVGMVASTSFKNYKDGIYDNVTDCHGMLNHAVLIVGYGTNSSTGEDYWIIKNSWGTTWGMDGYALVARNKLMCGIGFHASFPVVYKEQLDTTTTTTTTTTTVVPTVLACKSSHETASLITILLLQFLYVLFICKVTLV